MQLDSPIHYKMNQRPWRQLAGLGSLAIIVGSLFPWAQSERESTFSGLTGLQVPGGVVVLIAGLILMVGALFFWQRFGLYVGLMTSITVFGALALNAILVAKKNRENDMFGLDAAEVLVAIGWWIVLSGAVLALTASVAALVDRRHRGHG